MPSGSSEHREAPSNTAEAWTTTPPSNPQTPPIPDHELLRRIGGGSYGEVWLARNVVGTWRAVKVVRRATFERTEHFEREFRGIQKFEPISRSHEGFVDVLQIGRNDEAGFFYYVMELADGLGAESEQVGKPAGGKVGKRESGSGTPPTNAVPLPLNPAIYTPKTLRSLLSPAHFPTFPPAAASSRSPAHPNRLPVPDCVDIGVTLASALAHLHKHGLVHRDIKPSNIIFVGGVPKLADIGLVADASDARSFVGTVGFIPPEGPGSPQADLYSLGKVLYEISTGQDRQDFPQLPPDVLRGAPGSAGVSPAFPPQPRSSRREEAQSNSEHGTRNSELEVSALVELNEVLLKACHKDLRQRYASADAMRADLELLQRGQSVQRMHAAERRWMLARHLALATAIIALLAIAVSSLWNRFNELAIPRVNGVPEVNSIAVLPFVHEDKWEPHEYLAAMLSEETMNALMNCSGLRVAPRAAVFAFKRATNDVRQLGEQLGVNTVLAGTLKKASNQLYVAARLIHVPDGAELWSATYDRYRHSTNVADVASEIVTHVGQILKLSLPLSTLPQMQTNFTRKLAAYRLYSQARTLSANTQAGFGKTVQLLNGAIAEDPNLARAYAELAYCYQDSTGWLLPMHQAMPEAEKNAMRAIQLDDSLAKAHVALAQVLLNYKLDIRKAEAEFQNAIAVAPRDAASYAYYGMLLSALSRFSEAEEVLNRGGQVDPQSHLIHLGWCSRYYGGRDNANFSSAADRLLALETNSIVGLIWRVKAYERSREYGKALEIAERLKQMEPTPDLVALLGLIHGRLGQRDKAELLLQELRVLSQGGNRSSPIYDATIQIGLGKNAQAIQELERAVKDFPALVLSLKIEPLWDDLRQDPRFVELVKSVQFKE